LDPPPPPQAPSLAFAELLNVHDKIMKN
jgi:hypothetical protein